MKTQETESKLNSAKYIFYLPYIGKKYWESSRRILVLGESHYGSRDKTSTRQVVQSEYLDALKKGVRNKWIQCYRYTGAMLTGKGYHNSDYLWEDMAFSNFFQGPVGEYPNDKQYLHKNKDMIETGRLAFFELLDILQPHIVIVWGKSKMYWNWLPSSDRKILNSKKLLFCYENYPDTTIWCVRHPSRGFAYNNYHKEWLSVQSEYLE
jgi:hypothetical protein